MVLRVLLDEDLKYSSTLAALPDLAAWRALLASETQFCRPCLAPVPRVPVQSLWTLVRLA